MKKVLIILIIMFSFFTNAYSKYNKLVYDFDFNGIDGKKISLKDYSDKVQKRIKKLTFQLRESERREKAATDYAKGLKQKYEQVDKKLEETDTSYSTNF